MTTENEQQPADDAAAKAAADLAAEQARSTALEQKLTDIAAHMKAQLPEPLQKLIPSGLSISDQIDWIKTAAVSDLAKPRIVPRTDTKPPANTIPKQDPSELPPIARIASSYSAAAKR